MSQPLVPYNTEAHPPLRSQLFAAPPDAVPSVDELEATQSELKALKQRALERARKAAGDLKIIENEMKKMRELEKGKARALPLHKVKREPSYTPSLNQEERGFSPSIHSVPAGTPSSSSLPAINVSSPLLQKLPPEMRKVKKKDKDKKRKRDDESDGELDTQRSRKLSPHPPTHKEHHYKSSKPSNSQSTTGPDWNLPPPHSLLPQRPLSIPTLPAGPRKPIEVKEDFSKAKAPVSQIPIGTFYASIEPWIRQVREEDVGWLEYDGDTVGPYVTPELGRHYTDQWEDEDMQLYGGVPSSLDFSGSRNATAAASNYIGSGPLPKWDASGLTEADTITDKGLGPVTERLVSALLPAADQSTWKSMREAEDAYEARMAASAPGANGASPSKEKVLVADFEERVKDTVRFYGLLEGKLDFSQVVDDPISTALRQAQRQLREASAMNKARRARLAEVARDRLAYQEYVDARDALDKNITAMYTKLQKKDGPKASKKKKKGDGGGANGVNGSGGSAGPPMPLPNPAALGLGPDEEGTLVMPEALKQPVETRRQWVSVVGGGFEEEEQRTPGRVRGVPYKSIFEGIEEDVRRELGRSVFLSSKRADGANGSSVP
ncbi:hypothetical protein M0805_006603 [Coniferiporia weirii]|nr:hypothetical protein M0805_006603 [Coniferiporia weirii]